MTEILPRLFLGDFADSSVERSVSLVVNCTFELPFRNPKAEAQVRIALPDPPSDESHIVTMLDVLRGDLFDKIDACSCAGAGSHPVLIHCYRGAQRSAACAPLTSCTSSTFPRRRRAPSCAPADRKCFAPTRPLQTKLSCTSTTSKRCSASRSTVEHEHEHEQPEQQQ
jgi:hypothetical protein